MEVAITFCTEWSLVKHDRDGITAVPLYCRSWGCEICAPKRRYQLMQSAHAGRPCTFFTLTVNTNKFESPAAAARALANAFRNMVKRAKRESARDPQKRPLPYGATHEWGAKIRADHTVKNQVVLGGSTFEFLAVFEKTVRGWPHLHVISRVQWISQAWLSLQMGDMIGSPIVDIRRITNPHKLVSYVTKYIGKDPHRFDTCKRYWSSRGWEIDLLDDHDSDDPWRPEFEIVRRELTDIEREFKQMGWNPKQIKSGFTVHYYEGPGAIKPYHWYLGRDQEKAQQKAEEEQGGPLARVSL